MATTYTAQNFPLSVQGLTDSGTGLDVTSMFSYDIATGSAFIINDVVLLAKIPVGAVVTDYLVNCPILDTGGTTGRYALGDNTGSSGVFNATYATASTIGNTTAGILCPLGGFAGGTNTAVNVAGSVPSATWSTTGAVTTIYTPTVPTAGLYVGGWVFAFKVTTAAASATTTGLITGWLRYNMRSTAF